MDLKDFLNKLTGKSTPEASRKASNIITLIMSIIIILYAFFYVLQFKLKFQLLFNELNPEESIVQLYIDSFFSKLHVYSLIGILLVIGIYILSVKILTEAYLLFNKYAKKFILSNRTDDYDKIDKKARTPVFFTTLILSFIFIIYFVNYLSDEISYAINYGSEFNYSDIISDFLFFVIVLVGSGLIIRNYFLFKLKIKKKKKLTRLIINYNMVSVIFYATLFVLILNVGIPWAIKGFNHFISMTHSTFIESFTSFKETISEHNLVIDNEALTNLNMELNRILEMKFNPNNAVIQVSKPFLYFIVIIFTLIVVFPKFSHIGFKQSVVIILALILGTFISDFFTKYLYVNENTGNSLFVYALIYFILAFVINELSDLFKEKLTDLNK